MSIDAITSKGIKNICYPYTRSLSVTLFDENISEKFNDLKIERREIIHPFEVDYCNSMQIRNATNNVFFIGEQIDESIFKLSNLKVKAGIEERWDNTLNEILIENFQMIESRKFDLEKVKKNKMIMEKILSEI